MNRDYSICPDCKASFADIDIAEHWQTVHPADAKYKPPQRDPLIPRKIGRPRKPDSVSHARKIQQ